MSCAFLSQVAASCSPRRAIRTCSGHRKHFDKADSSLRFSRRALIRTGFAFVVGGILSNSSFVRADEQNLNDPSAGKPDKLGPKTSRKNRTDDGVAKCKNCSGTGMVQCELCSGTGFWRALSKNDVNQRYQGVVCPECEGSGTLRCPVCLGTGEGNVRGLLRRRRVEPGPGRVLQTNM